jgi:hypothetical protein
VRMLGGREVFGGWYLRMCTWMGGRDVH